MSRAAAEVEYARRPAPGGGTRDCVIAECLESGYATEPVWGHGEASVKRALAKLTEECPCGASWHYDADEEDDDGD